MNLLRSNVNRLLLLTVVAFLLAPQVQAQGDKREFYEIKTYTLKSKDQEAQVDVFLKSAYLPAMHKAGIKNVGVFKPVETDTTYGKRIYLLIPYTSLDQFLKITKTVFADKQFNSDGKEYLDAVYTNPPYVRIESVLLKAFIGMQKMQIPTLTGARSERIYELRSYESHTEKIHINKVEMFNKGDEVGLFKRLGFNAVFYGEVISGSHMPNLMYMTTFDNKASRDEHWKSFSADPQWKQLSAMPEYQHNVSKNTQYFLRPTEYSDY
ncbi:MAG: NIPSNAP family protein [Bacteroidia bacterium]|nr:NIPSNAP family protein [Bacteroidia bacterium]